MSKQYFIKEMSHYEYMFEKMLKEKFPAITEENRKRHPMKEIVENLKTAFMYGYDSN